MFFSLTGLGNVLGQVQGQRRSGLIEPSTSLAPARTVPLLSVLDIVLV